MSPFKAKPAAVKAKPNANPADLPADPGAEPAAADGPDSGGTAAAPEPAAASRAPEAAPVASQASEGLFTPGELMGVPETPPTAQEHAERLGSAANTASDIGWMLGTAQ